MHLAVIATHPRAPSPLPSFAREPKEPSTTSLGTRGLRLLESVFALLPTTRSSHTCEVPTVLVFTRKGPMKTPRSLPLPRSRTSTWRGIHLRSTPRRALLLTMALRLKWTARRATRLPAGSAGLVFLFPWVVNASAAARGAAVRRGPAGLPSAARRQRRRAAAASAQPSPEAGALAASRASARCAQKAARLADLQRNRRPRPLPDLGLLRI